MNRLVQFMVSFFCGFFCGFFSMLVLIQAVLILRPSWTVPRIPPSPPVNVRRSPITIVKHNHWPALHVEVTGTHMYKMPLQAMRWDWEYREATGVHVYESEWAKWERVGSYIFCTAVAKD